MVTCFHLGIGGRGTEMRVAKRAQHVDADLRSCNRWDRTFVYRKQDELQQCISQASRRDDEPSVKRRIRNPERKRFEPGVGSELVTLSQAIKR